MTARRRGSTLIRCAHACSRRFSVVVVVGAADPSPSEATTTRAPPGVESGALVAWGSAGRGLLLGEDEEAEVEVIRPMAEGVGVKGGGLEGEVPLAAVLRRLAVGVRGVTKTLVGSSLGGGALGMLVSGGLVVVEEVLAEAVLSADLGRPRFLLAGCDSEAGLLVALLVLRLEEEGGLASSATELAGWLAWMRADLLVEDMVAKEDVEESD